MSKMSSQKKFVKDSGYAYVILLSCFMLRAMENFPLVTFGIYVLEYLEYFHTDKAFGITFLGGLYSLSQALTGPVGGYLTKKLGARPYVMASTVLFSLSLLIAGSFPSLVVLTVCFIVSGCCSQSMMLVGNAVVQQYFDKKRSLAAGIAMSGASWGFFMWPPLARFLIDKYTWRGSYYVYAGIIANCLVFGSLLRPVPQCHATERETKNVKLVPEEKAKDVYLKYVNWIMFCIGVFLWASGHVAPAIYFPITAHRQGIDEKKIPFIISAIGAMGIVFRPFSGFIGDFRYINRLMMTAVSLTLSGIVIIISTTVVGFPSFMVMALVFGVLQSIYSATVGAQVVDVFTLENVEVGTGMTFLFLGLGLSVLNPLAGLLIDLTGTTNSVFYVFGSAHILGGFVFAIVYCLTKHLNKRYSPIDKYDDNIIKQVGLAVSMESLNT